MIELKNISYLYKSNGPETNPAVTDISLSISDGEFIGIAGHTGSGKTTIAQILAGLILPAEGNVLIDGTPCKDYKEASRMLRKRVGIVFQYPEHQLFEETVYKDIAFGPKTRNLSEEEIDKCVRESAALVHLDESLFDKSPFELSGGQKRRVAIAGVLATKPSVLILDEPAAGLDPRGRDRLFSELRQIREQSNTAVVLISHSMEDLAENVDRVIVLDHGTKAEDAPVKEVFSNYTLLKKCGLDVPEITRIIHLLKKGGMKLNGEIFTVDEACSEIVKYLGVDK